MFEPEVHSDRNGKMLAIDLLNTQRHKELLHFQNLILNNVVAVGLRQWKVDFFYFEEIKCNVCGSVAEVAFYGGVSRSMENAIPSSWGNFMGKFGLGSFCFCDTLEDIVEVLESGDPLTWRNSSWRGPPKIIPLFAARTWSYNLPVNTLL